MSSGHVLIGKNAHGDREYFPARNMVMVLWQDYAVLSVSRCNNLLHQRPVQTNNSRNLAVAHILNMHSENIGTKLLFISDSQVTFGLG